MAPLITSHNIGNFGRCLKKINLKKRKLKNQNKARRNDNNQTFKYLFT